MLTGNPRAPYSTHVHSQPPASHTIRPLLGCNEVAHILGVTPYTVREMVRRGDLAAVKPNGWNIKFRAEDIERLVGGNNA